MSKYKVLQTFTHQAVDYHQGEEVEIEDSKAEEIGSSYLEKVVEDSESSPKPPAGGSEEGGESRTDIPPAGDKGQE